MPDTIHAPDSITSEEAFGSPVSCIENNEALLRSTKISYVCVELKYGSSLDPKFARYTDWTTEADFAGAKFESVPTMEFKIGRHTAKLDEDSTTITLPQNLAFIAALVTGEPHSRIRVRIFEVSQIDTTQKVGQVIFLGLVSSITKNVDQIENRAQLVCTNIKSRMKVNLGVVASHQCQLIFTKKGCNATPFTTTGEVYDIQGLSLFISGDFSTFNKVVLRRGICSFEGLDVTIRDGDFLVGGAVLRLNRRPPRVWLNQVIDIQSGCDRQLTTCRGEYANEDSWLGLGIAMPAYDPLLESR